MKRVLPIATLALLQTNTALSPAAADAASDGAAAPICPLEAGIQPTRLLRRISLAMQGRPPTMAEYEQVRGQTDDAALEALVDAWFETDAYRLQMRRYHMELLWSEIGDLDLSRFQQIEPEVGDGWTRWMRELGRYGRPSCIDTPQQELQPGYAAGDPVTQCIENDEGQCQEGYAMVQPYWDPATEIKVCAFDAQVAATFINPYDPEAEPLPCTDFHWRIDLDPDTQGTQSTTDCGCGPNLRSCYVHDVYSDVRSSDILTAAFKEQLLLLVDDHTRGQQPYRSLLTTKAVHLNGPLTHYYRHLAPMAQFNTDYKATIPLAEGVGWTDTGWYAGTRTADHAGVLTLPAFLMRFTTDRARANRVRIAFMGQHFVPGQEATPGCDPDALDVTQLCYCDQCHRTLEPMAKYFSPYSGGTSYVGWLDTVIRDTPQECEALFPPDGAACSRFYGRRFRGPDPDNPDEQTWLRSLKSLEFSEDHPEYVDHFDQGPRGFVADEVLQRRNGSDYSHLAWATTQHLFGFLSGAEPIIDASDPDDDSELVDSLATEFEQSDFNFRQLVRSIVLSDAFRRTK